MRELALHILDLIQNSLEAEAKWVCLEIREDEAGDTLTIRVTDDGKGMDEETLARVTDPFITGRTTRRVGLGLPLMQMTAQRCGGYLKIQSKPGAGTAVEAVYRLSHWDRPPLGNLIATLKTILTANPELDFHYSHTVGPNNFSLRTRDLTDILGNVPLTHPDVLLWIQNYLTENIGKLYGGVQHENS
jgi:hypothetical protein